MPPAVVQQPGVNTGSNNQVVSQTEINNVPVDDNDVEIEEITEPEFPHAKLATLDEKISNLRWVVPVLPEQELECLLNAAIDLCRKGFYHFLNLIWDPTFKKYTNIYLEYFNH